MQCCISCYFGQLKPLSLRMDYAKLLDVLTSFLESHGILPRAVCFAASRPASHVTCCFIRDSRQASEPIRSRLFIDYIMKIQSITYIVDDRINPVINPVPNLK